MQHLECKDKGEGLFGSSGMDVDAVRDLWSKRVQNTKKSGVEIVPKRDKGGSNEMKQLIDEVQVLWTGVALKVEEPMQLEL